MSGMSIQDRYNDIASISGLSEEIIRRVYKATQHSVAQSLKKGERATIPGICTFTPELRDKINYKATDAGSVLTKYIKVKASASPALNTELEKINSFDSTEDEKEKLENEAKGMSKLNFISNPELHEFHRYGSSSNGIRTTQINALL